MAKDKEPIAWITVHGRRVPIFEGESKADAVKKVTQNNSNNSSNGSSMRIKKIPSVNGYIGATYAVYNGNKIEKIFTNKKDADAFVSGGQTDNKERQIAENKQEADKLNNENSTQSVHKRAIAELNDSRYKDGTYDITTKKSVSFSNGYQVTFCQIGDNYTDADYQQKVNECLKMSSDGKTYAGKFGGSPEISFHCNSKEEAIAYAKANNQISIWDWAADNGNGAEIDCGGSGDRNKTRAQVEKEWEEAAKKNK